MRNVLEWHEVEGSRQMHVKMAVVLNKERYEKATEDFAVAPEENDFEWINKLKKNPVTGLPAKVFLLFCTHSNKYAVGKKVLEVL